MKDKYYKKHKNSTKVSDDVMKNGLLIGCHHGLKLKELKYMCSIFKKYLVKKIQLMFGLQNELFNKYAFISPDNSDLCKSKW